MEYPASRSTRTARSNSWLRTSTWSVSYVETAKMLIPAFARGVVNPANTPVMFRSNGPRTASTDHGPSDVIPEGTAATSHTADTSSGVRVTEKNVPCMAQEGSDSSAAQRQIAYEPGRRSSVSPRSVTSAPRVSGRLRRHGAASAADLNSEISRAVTVIPAEMLECVYVGGVCNAAV